MLLLSHDEQEPIMLLIWKKMFVPVTAVRKYGDCSLFSTRIELFLSFLAEYQKQPPRGVL